jgi:toxin ParE1/3/4
LKAWPVRLSDDAARDLDDIISYIDGRDTPARGDYVLDQIESALRRLSVTPLQGVCPRELSSVGVREFREILFKPYRIIYRVGVDEVLVLVIADGRRDMQTLLQRRLLQSD